ncbi:MAG: hypothetical protein INR73_14715 [Williamsia sp.]|nr:hypothetical protein [Williamsia sp.]
MLEILSPVISLLAALIAFFSKSWRTEKKGMGKLNFIAWITLTLILAGTIVTIINISNSQAQKTKMQVGRDNIKHLAYKRIAIEAVRQLTPVIDILISEHDTVPRLGILFDSLPSRVAKELNNTWVTNRLKNINFHETSNPLPNTLFLRQSYFQKYCYNAIVDLYGDNALSLKQVRDDWADYLDTYDLIMIDSIINHSFHAAVKSLDLPKDGIEYNPFTNSSFEMDFSNYIQLISKLLSKVEPKQEKFSDYFD